MTHAKILKRMSRSEIRFWFFSRKEKGITATLPISLSLGAARRKSALLANSSFITRESARVLLLFVIALVSRTQRTRVHVPSRDLRARVSTRVRLHHAAVPQWRVVAQHAVKRYHCQVVRSLRRQAIETSHFHRPRSPFCVSFFFPLSLTVLPFSTFFLPFSKRESIHLTLFREVVIARW